MITGFNTDVLHEGLVFHVQTEDKGLNNPHIETLLYLGGQVVSAKRMSYADLVVDGRGNLRAIAARMKNQHQGIIEAVRDGRYDRRIHDKLPEAAADAAVAAAPPPEPKEVDTEAPPTTLDEVILDYLNAEAQRDQLLLVMDSDGELIQGVHRLLAFETQSSKTGEAVPRARVTVKMISTTDRPSTLASGFTDERGELEVALKIPRLAEGTAALIVTASSHIGNAEIKHLL